MEYLTGDDYPDLCDKCRAAISVIAGICEELPDEYAGDEEGPCNYAYDNGLLCGGNDCAERTYSKKIWLANTTGIDDES